VDNRTLGLAVFSAQLVIRLRETGALSDHDLAVVLDRCADVLGGIAGTSAVEALAFVQKQFREGA
jgi:hypothetical protein